MEHESAENQEEVFGYINTNIYYAWGAIIKIFDDSLDEGNTDILDLDMEQRLLLEKEKGDAEILAYIIHDEEHGGQAAQAAYRGIAFAQMVLCELRPDIALATLDEFWGSSLWQEQSSIKERLMADTKDYLDEHNEVNNMLMFYMIELSEEDEYDHMVEIGAVMTFRQAEIDAAIDEQVLAYQAEIEHAVVDDIL